MEDKIKHIDEQIALLQKLKAQYLAKIDALSFCKNKFPQSYSTRNLTQANVAIFQDYFRGRDSVYAHLWINQRSHKKGYSPTCRNEWVRALCRKPQVRCSECPNQAFLAFDNTAIARHLSGKDVIGMYPMTEDEKCFFLAFDFEIKD